MEKIQSIRGKKIRITHKHLKRTVFFSVLAAGVAALGIAAWTYVYFAKDISDKDRLMNKARTGLILLDDQGEPFFSFYNAKTPEPISLQEIPQNIKDALISSEDREFYEHPGFSIRGIGRAFVTNLKHSDIRQGGSTISQELIKLALLNPKKTYLRKFQELILSIELTRRYSKDEILEMYLNSVYFGEGAFGIQNASETYFGKDAKDLTLSEAALLIGLLPAPSSLSPISNNPDAAYQRRALVLNAMVDEQKITMEQANQAENEQLTFKNSETDINQLAPHFALYVKDKLIQEYGEETIIRSGFVVKTTLNRDWQQKAEQVLQQQVTSLRASNASNGAVVVIDPTNGAIKVMVGSHDWFDQNNGKINMAVTPRQPGSSFKPIIYADALQDRVITSATVLMDRPKTFGISYKPQNYDRTYRGAVTVRRALANSLNVPAVEIMEKVGLNNGINMAQSVGITTLDNDVSNYGLSLVLGSGEVPLLEMTNAYAAFAHEGKQFPHTPYTEIEDKFSNKVYNHNPKDNQVLDKGAAYIITSILSDNQARAEVFGSALTINKPAAVKTGTSEFYRDSWTIGYTPSLVTGVWIGNNDNSPMSNVAGSLGAAPVWRALMQEFVSENQAFTVPDNVIKARVCMVVRQEKDSDGDGDDIPDKVESTLLNYEDYFIKGTEPKNCNSQHLEELNKQVEEDNDSDDDDDDDDEEDEDNDSDEDRPRESTFSIIF